MSAVLAPAAPAWLDAAVASGFVEGMHPALPDPDYRKVLAISATGAKRILRSAAHFAAPQPEQTPAMRIGSLTHMAILEPDRFAAETIVGAKFDRRTKEGKAAAEAFEAAAAGRAIVTHDEHEQMQAISAAVRSHPAARRLLINGRAEVSLMWRDGVYGVPCKARFDWWRDDGVLVDLKTCEDASPAGFQRAIGRYQYHLQAAMYCNAAEAVLGNAPAAFVFVCVEKDPPYAVGVYALDAASISAGHELVDDAISRYAECIASGHWPAYADTVLPISAPAWALNRKTATEE